MITENKFNFNNMQNNPTNSIPNVLNSPINSYNYQRSVLEEKLKEDIETLDLNLEYALKIPSFAWHIFNTNCSNYVFFKNLDNNYIDDIRNAVNEYLEYTDDILRNPMNRYKCHQFPFQIDNLLYDAHLRVEEILKFKGLCELTYLKKYIVFYEQTIEKCFELQDKITKRTKVLERFIKNNPLPKDEIDIRYFSWINIDLCGILKEEYQDQYKKCKKIIKKSEKIEKIKLFVFSIFKKCKDLK
jgi:hypothetical protein